MNLKTFTAALAATAIAGSAFAADLPARKFRVPGGGGPARILYLHGGGYIGTSPNMYAAFIGAMVGGTGCEVFVADYRLAPEFPFPAGLDDAVDVYECLVASGVDPTTLIVAGDSGGGGLATSLIGELSDRDLPAPSALVLFSPEVDLYLNRPSVSENADRDILPWNIPVTSYLHGIHPDDARVSAVFADPAAYPPTFVALGSDEMFRDGILAFSERLIEAGVSVEVHQEDAMFHVFPIVMPWADAAKRVFASMDRFISRHVATSGSNTIGGMRKMCSRRTVQPSAAAARWAASLASANIAARASASLWRMSIVQVVVPGTAVTTPGQQDTLPTVVTPTWRSPISANSSAKRLIARKESRRIGIGIVPACAA